MKIDKFGNEIKVGDIVIYRSSNRYDETQLFKVIAISPKMSLIVKHVHKDDNDKIILDNETQTKSNIKRCNLINLSAIKYDLIDLMEGKE